MKATHLLLFCLLLGLSLSQTSLNGPDTVQDPLGILKGDWIMPELDFLNIHLVPHTHDDIGFIKTVDEYYYGSQKSVSRQGVQYILDSVFPILSTDPKKRFIYVEMGFFERWWNEQEDTMKSLVRQMLQNGQFEFINGGYCMNDEAAVYYEDSIDQMTLGHQFLLQTFGVIPDVGWHIDPFGQASAQAALFAQMGFKAFYFSRIDYQDQIHRLGNKEMEMIWIPNTSQGIENAIFSHVTYFHYGSPEGFDFDLNSKPNPIQDDPALEGYDVPIRADEFDAWFRLMQGGYRAPHLMHTTGGDFQFMAAGIIFKNWDRLFGYIQQHPELGLNVAYSTPSEYLSAIYALNIEYPLNKYDFFPYADIINAYWTGYFTSRTSVKGMVRQEGKFLQAIKRLLTKVTWDQTSQFVLNNFAQVDKAVDKLEEAMATAQHHDAVTGTERQHVAEDYKLRLSIGDNAAKQGFVYPYFQEKIQNDLGLSGVELSTCNLNTSAVFCDATYQSLTQNKPVLLAIFNSGYNRTSTIRVKVPNGNVQALNSAGANLPTDVICSNSTDSTDCDLFFTDNFAGLQTAYYYLTPSTTSNQVEAQGLSPGQIYQVNSNQTFTTQSVSSFGFKYCSDSTLQNCYSTQFDLTYSYYESFQDEDGSKGQVGGAYIFRPSQNTKNSPLSYDTPNSASIYQGKNLLHIHLTGSKSITDIRIYNDLTNGIEVQTFVNSIYIGDNQGKEIVMVVEAPSINNGNTFYTDSMGMEMQPRVVNFRPTWELVVTEPASSNFYPVQTAILVQDFASNESLTIIPDRAQGGASLNAGQIQMLIHRRLLQDDKRGVGEALNELDWDGNGMRQWMTHTLLFNKPGVLETSHRKIQINNDMANIVLLAPVSQVPSSQPIQDVFVDSFSDLDPYIKLLSRPFSTSKFLLRFHNMDEINTRYVNTTVFGRTTGVIAVSEMSLTANQHKTQMINSRYNWNNLGLNNPSFAKDDYLSSSQFELRPLEIRTFVVDFGSESVEDVINV